MSDGIPEKDVAVNNKPAVNFDLKERVMKSIPIATLDFILSMVPWVLVLAGDP